MGAGRGLVAVEDYRGLRLLSRHSVQPPDFEVLVGAEDEVESVLALSPARCGPEDSTVSLSISRDDLYEGTYRKPYSRTMRETLSQRNI